MKWQRDSGTWLYEPNELERFEREADEQALEAELEPCKRRLNFGGDVMDPRDTPAYKPGTTAPPNAKVAAGGAPRLWRGGYSELLRLLRINPIRRGDYPLTTRNP